MSNCAEFSELISAYADGELAGPDKRRLEEHLAECENCSAFLELCRDMSAALTGSCESAPESLRDSVMNAITIENTSGAADSSAADSDVKKRGTVRVILTWFIPAAACLALILFAAPRLFNIGRSSSDSISIGESMSAADKSENKGAAGNSMTSGTGSASAGGGSGAAASGSDAAEAYSPSMAPAPEPGGEDAETDRNSDFGLMINDEDSLNTEYDEPRDDGASSEEHGATPGLSPDPDTQNIQPEYPLEAPAGALEDSPLPVPLPVIDGDWPAEWPGNWPDEWPDSWPDEWPDAWPELEPSTGGSLFTDSIYAIIQINGGLPELMAIYGLDPIDDVDMYFEIPREYADMFIEFVRDLDGVTVTIVDENGGYAVVIYTPAE